MKAVIIALSVMVLSAVSTAQAQQSLEISFNPSTQWYDINIAGKLTLWNVPEVNNLALTADPSAGASKLGIATCVAFLENARKESVRVGIGYDPNTRSIVWCGKPRI